MHEISSKIYSPNFDKKKRDHKLIKFIIIHYTGMKKESDAIKKLTSYKSNVSCHFFIKTNGQLIQMVPESYIAWHAGKSKWGNFKSLNKNSIGIEIHNPGHEFNYKSFNNKQIVTLINLLKKLKKKYRIKIENILGHSDIAPQRKKDPGEKFPWEILAKKKLCLWPKMDLKKITRFREIKINKKMQESFFRNIKKIGYSKISYVSNVKSIYFLIIAFQRRFRKQLVNGKIDLECYLISKNLANY